MSLSNDELARVCRGWGPTSLVTFYDWVYRENGMTFPAHLLPVAYALCDKRINKLMVQIGPGSGKSELLSKIYPAWLLGHDPTQQIIGVSAGSKLSLDFVQSAMDFIENSQAFKLSFPQVRPDKDRGWSAAAGAFVTGHRIGSSDASYFGVGLGSSVLTGKHASLMCLDDIHDEGNSANEELCKGVIKTYTSQLIGRADAMRGMRMILAGRRWSVFDIYGVLEQNEDWVVMKLPAEREGSKKLYWDIYVPDYVDPDEKTTPFECIFTDGMIHTYDGDIELIKDTLEPLVQVQK